MKFMFLKPVADQVGITAHAISLFLDRILSHGLTVNIDTNDNPTLEQLGFDKVKITIKVGGR